MVVRFFRERNLKSMHERTAAPMQIARPLHSCSQSMPAVHLVVERHRVHEEQSHVTLMCEPNAKSWWINRRRYIHQLLAPQRRMGSTHIIQARHVGERTVVHSDVTCQASYATATSQSVSDHREGARRRVLNECGCLTPQRSVVYA